MTLSVMPKKADGWPLAAALIGTAAVFGLAVGCAIGRVFVWWEQR